MTARLLAYEVRTPKGVEHMPFAGHRTVAEIDASPCNKCGKTRIGCAYRTCPTRVRA